jgi:hypothetical protein
MSGSLRENWNDSAGMFFSFRGSIKRNKTGNRFSHCMVRPLVYQIAQPD